MASRSADRRLVGTLCAFYSVMTDAERSIPVRVYRPIEICRMIASTGFADDTQEPRLILPEGLVIAELVQDRMARQLERAPSHVAGIVAETGELPPGSSYRVEAEWRALDCPSDAYEPSANPVHGAVLVRPGVRRRRRGGAVVDVDGHASRRSRRARARRGGG